MHAMVVKALNPESLQERLERRLCMWRKRRRPGHWKQAYRLWRARRGPRWKYRSLTEAKRHRSALATGRWPRKLLEQRKLHRR